MTTLAPHQANTFLQQLITLGGWQGNETAIAEAIPHMKDQLNADDIVRTLENLKVQHATIRCFETEITEDECPALVFPDGEAPFIVLERSADGLVAASLDQTAGKLQQPRRRKCTLISVDTFVPSQKVQKNTTVLETFAAFRPMMPWLVLASFLTNSLGLLTPLLIMAIYDRVIPSQSTDLLLALVIGVGIVLGADFAFRHARTKAIAHVGRNGERELLLALFRKIMALPIHQFEKSDVEQQVARFRQFEALREIFTGQVMTTILDLPFALLFLGVLLYLAPPIGVLTLGAAALFLVMSFLIIPVQSRLDKTALEKTAENRILVQDAVLHQEALVNLGLADQWIARAHPAAEAAEIANRKARQFQTLMQSIAQTFTALVTVGAIVLSAHAVLAGEMTFGALIAVIALVSKVMSPIHALHANMPQILSFRQSQAQADRVLNLSEEMELGSEKSHQKTLSGAVTFSGVTHRPDPLNAPVLSQVSFRVKPGELVLVMGRDVAGRTALLDLIDGLYTPLAGTIEHDEIDIRQIARDELRRSITYATYETGLFYGTVAQNFKLAAPSLTDDQIWAAIDDMGMTADIAALPDGFESRLTDDVLSHLPEETAKSLVLARSLARRAPIYLFSEPTHGLGQDKRLCFKTWLETKGRESTVFLSTADRSFLPMADRYIYLDEGRVVANETGETGLMKIRAALEHFGG